MKIYTRIQINNSFSIPGFVKKNIVHNKTIAKWVINNNNTVNLYFISKEDGPFKDYATDECKVLYRRVHNKLTLSIPVEVSNILNCKKFDCIEWNVNQKDITINCYKKLAITDISGLF